MPSLKKKNYSPSSTSDIGAQTLQGISSINKNKSIYLTENYHESRMVNKEVDSNEDNEVDEASAYVDNSSEHDDLWRPNSNTSAGVIRLSLLALSAAIHAMEDIGSEGLTALMSCPVMEHHLESMVNARFAVLKIQYFYRCHVHQWSSVEDDYDDYYNGFDAWSDYSYNTYDSLDYHDYRPDDDSWYHSHS